jgi:hypothetical protein
VASQEQIASVDSEPDAVPDRDPNTTPTHGHQLSAPEDISGVAVTGIGPGESLLEHGLPFHDEPFAVRVPHGKIYTTRNVMDWCAIRDKMNLNFPGEDQDAGFMRLDTELSFLAQQMITPQIQPKSKSDTS